MDEFNVLLVENNKDWQNSLESLLNELGENVKTETASTITEAERCFNSGNYDLVIFDLLLPQDDLAAQQGIERIAIESLGKLRKSKSNKFCGLIILTGYGNVSYVKQALIDFKATEFFDKLEIDKEQFKDAARSSVLQSRLWRVKEKFKKRCLLTVHFGVETITGSEIRGPDLFSSNSLTMPLIFKGNNLSQRGDNLDLLITGGGPNVWRQAAKSLGDDVYEDLSGDKQFLENFTRGQTVSQSSEDLWINFSGPANVLGVPFELIRVGNDYLCYQHILIRGITGYRIKSIKPFHEFIEELNEQDETLHILIVGSNSDGEIPVAELEASRVTQILESSLSYLGIKVEITCLLEKNASYENVSSVLRSGKFHIFHYSGHGNFDEQLPETSGLELLDQSSQPKILTAADLNLLTRNSNLKLVYLSCCLGAKNATGVGRGDFSGTLEALARADVPSVLGYRWTLSDESALLLATDFYKFLWRTLSPAESLFYARHEVAIQNGMDDDTWASPVLLMQNL